MKKRTPKGKKTGKLADDVPGWSSIVGRMNSTATRLQWKNDALQSLLEKMGRATDRIEQAARNEAVLERHSYCRETTLAIVRALAHGGEDAQLLKGIRKAIADREYALVEAGIPPVEIKKALGLWYPPAEDPKTPESLGVVG